MLVRFPAENKFFVFGTPPRIFWNPTSLLSVYILSSGLKSRNACYHSVQNLLSSSLLYKNMKIQIYRIIMLPVVLYGCETWSFTLRKESRLGVFENRVFRRIFGSKWDDLIRVWRKLHNEEVSDLHFSLNIVRMIKSRKMRWSSHVWVRE